MLKVKNHPISQVVTLKLVPKARLELARALARHPLKMVCLPIPPLRQGTVYILLWAVHVNTVSVNHCSRLYWFSPGKWAQPAHLMASRFGCPLLGMDCSTFDQTLQPVLHLGRNHWHQPSLLAQDACEHQSLVERWPRSNGNALQPSAPCLILLLLVDFYPNNCGRFDFDASQPIVLPLCLLPGLRETSQ